MRQARYSKAVILLPCTLLGILVACRSPARATPYFGLVGCLTESFPRQPLVIARALQPDTVLLVTADAGLSVHVRDARLTTPVNAARVRLILGADTLLAATDARGFAGDLRHSGSGRALLLVTALGYAPARDSVDLRAGFRDSVALGIGKSSMCLYADP